jgi:hypothetical protein
LRKGGIASGELRGDLYWDETAVGETGKDAPVGVPHHLDLICRTAVYVIRMYGGEGGEVP